MARDCGFTWVISENGIEENQDNQKKPQTIEGRVILSHQK